MLSTVIFWELISEQVQLKVANGNLLTTEGLMPRSTSSQTSYFNVCYCCLFLLVSLPHANFESRRDVGQLSVSEKHHFTTFS